MNDDPAIAEALARARGLVLRGEDEAAKAAYIDVLRRDATYFDALNELGALAYASGHRSAARTSYVQAVRCHPNNPVAHVNLANLLCEDDDYETAQEHFEMALQFDPDMPVAHQGLARVLSEMGETIAAEAHFRKGYAGQAIVRRRYRGQSPSVPVLLLVSARGGNIPTHPFLDDRVFEISALYAEFHDPSQPLPPHLLVLNAIGDADLCGEALQRAAEVIARTDAPVINLPAKILPTGRADNARRLAGLQDVVAPKVALLPRDAIASAPGLTFPLLLRAPGFHTGRHFVRVEQTEDLDTAIASLPGDDLLVIGYLDTRGPDGQARKYRAMIIDGRIYPLHLAISHDWKVHYFTADMAMDAAYRDEERRYLDDIVAVVGTRGMAALEQIGMTLGLDYGGVDFGLDAEGRVLLFEANATMVINPPEPDPMWDYRRAPIGRAIDAAKQMLLSRAKA
jgi:hypothetical protein